MIEEDTVFILGAGASCPYGFPDGKKLRYEIYSFFETDVNRYYNKFKDLSSEIDLFALDAKGFAKDFQDSTTKSIDLFLSRNRDFMQRGKWAIIFRILIHENNSKFREETINKDQDWYSYLFHRLSEDFISKEEYIHMFDKRIYFITFNYDRSLEYFLHESYFKSFLEIDNAKKLEQIKKLKVIHIFGQVSGLNWQDANIKYKYRIDPYSIDLQKIQKEIQIIYEQEKNPKLEEAKDLIKKAKRIFFLGFGFAKENLEILDIPNILNMNQKIYGTGYGLYDQEINKIQNSLIPPVRKGERFNNNIKIENCDCLRLLRKYLS